MRKFLILAAAASSVLTTPSFAQNSGPSSPTVDQTNPSSCMGKERASRNSNGGDRDRGEFGTEVQANYIAVLMAAGYTYREAVIQAWLLGCVQSAR